MYLVFCYILVFEGLWTLIYASVKCGLRGSCPRERWGRRSWGGGRSSCATSPPGGNRWRKKESQIFSFTFKLTAVWRKKETTSMLDLPINPLSSSSFSSSLLDSSSRSYIESSSSFRFLKSFLTDFRDLASSTLNATSWNFSSIGQFFAIASRWEESSGPACHMVFSILNLK